MSSRAFFQNKTLFLYIYTNLIDILRDSIYNQDKREKIEGIENERHDQNFRYRRKIGDFAQHRIQSAEWEIRARKDQDRGTERRFRTRIQKFSQNARFIRGAGKQKDPFAFHEDAHEYPLPYLRFKEHRGGTF